MAERKAKLAREIEQTELEIAFARTDLVSQKSELAAIRMLTLDIVQTKVNQC